MNVLSLFDGISCGRAALDELGIKPTRYFASEVDKHAIKIAQKNYPDTIQVGDVQNLKGWMFPKIDLFIGGSPCQGFSFAGKQLAFDDPRSKLFFEYVRLLRECQPRYFLLENVCMKKEYIAVITEMLGVEPIMINSALVSAQNRKRLYWTNIPGVGQPKDRGILLKHIVHENTDCFTEKSQTILSTLYKENEASMMKRRKKGLMVNQQTGTVRTDLSSCTSDGKVYCLTATYARGSCPQNSYERKQRTVLWETLAEYIVPFDKTLRILEKEVERGKVGYFRKDSNGGRIYHIHDKAVTLMGDNEGGAAKMGQYLFGSVDAIGVREPTFVNTAGVSGPRFKTDGKAYTLRDVSSGALFGYTTPDYINKKQNGQRFSDGKKFYALTARDQHGILVEGYIRKLTPIECERLQTLPDGYTEGISKTQRYKCLGNGWTRDVIVHIFKELSNEYKTN